MATVLRVPEVATGATEAVLAEWMIDVGAAFEQGDPIVVIETDKAVVEVEADQSSVLLHTLVAGGSSVEVGAPMALVGSADELASDVEALLAELGVATVAAAPAPPRRDLDEPASEPMSVSVADVVDAGSLGGRVFISPIARKLLREAGLDVTDVTGTGPNGRIVRRDVERAVDEQDRSAATTTESAPSPVVDERAAGATSTEVPHSRVRLAVARRLTESKQQVPHFYVRREAAADALVELRRSINESSPVRVSVNDLLVKAVALTHRAVPEANVVWGETSMRRFSTVDVSIAVASARGLVTPVLRDVASMSVVDVATSTQDVISRASEGRLQQRDLEGGSISVTNLGMHGVDEFAAIINPPQSAILAVGAVRELPVVRDGEVRAGRMVNLVMSVDHRAIDGALAAEWMTALVDLIERPLALLL